MSAENIPHPTDASIILTYRCPMKCKMCNIWFNPTKKDDEIKAADLRTLPRLKFINLTGGEPFVRDDLAEIVNLLPPGSYTRQRLCDQLNSAIGGHAWGQVYGTVQ